MRSIPKWRKLPNETNFRSNNQNTKNTMNCHECKHCRNLPFDAHNSCGHPVLSNGLEWLAALSVHTTAEFKPFGLSVSEHGLRNGWANWPINFDPVWVNSCNQFQAKGGEEHEENAEQRTESCNQPRS